MMLWFMNKYTYDWVVFHPLYTLNNQGFGHCSPDFFFLSPSLLVKLKKPISSIQIDSRGWKCRNLHHSYWLQGVSIISETIGPLLSGGYS